jgi:hypothetical protein
MITPPGMLVFAPRNVERLVRKTENPEAVLPVYTHNRLWVVIELIGDMPVLLLGIKGKNGIPLFNCLRQLTMPEMPWRQPLRAQQ